MSSNVDNADPVNRKSNKNKQNQNSKSHILRKRAPQKFQRSENIIYVSNKTHIKGLFEKSEKLINTQENEIVLYALGAAIQKGINVALQLCEKYPTFNLSLNTLTTDLIDDLEPLEDDFDYETNKRHNSGVQIRLFRLNPIEEKHPILESNP